MIFDKGAIIIQQKILFSKWCWSNSTTISKTERKKERREEEKEGGRGGKRKEGKNRERKKERRNVNHYKDTALIAASTRYTGLKEY